jgi:hypothetical protein
MNLLIYTRNRKANSIANRLLENNEVVYVGWQKHWRAYDCLAIV